MSKRRQPGDVVARRPGSGFHASEKPRIVQIVPGTDDWCALDCGDPKCREWDVQTLDGGDVIYHVSECEMEDQ